MLLSLQIILESNLLIKFNLLLLFTNEIAPLRIFCSLYAFFKFIEYSDYLIEILLDRVYNLILKHMLPVLLKCQIR